MKKYMYIIKKNKYCLILALFILSFYLGRGVCALAKNTGKNTNSTVIVIDRAMVEVIRVRFPPPASWKRMST